MAGKFNSRKADLIYYGPHPCEKCGLSIVKVSAEQGGQELDVPSGIVYPNSMWRPHVCPPKAQAA